MYRKMGKVLLIIIKKITRGQTLPSKVVAEVLILCQTERAVIFFLRKVGLEIFL